MNIKSEKFGNLEGGGVEWNIEKDGEWVGDLEKTRPQKFTAAYGYVFDTDKSWAFAFIAPGGNSHDLKAKNHRAAIKEIAALCNAGRI